MDSQINIMVGGEAGQGVQSVGFLLAKALARGGYYVFADQDYESRVRGGHNFYRVRASDREIGAVRESLDILLALNKESVELHRREVAPAGVIVFDGEQPKNTGRSFAVPLVKLAEQKAGGKIMSNTVALGAAFGLLSYDLRIVEQVLKEHFGSEKVGQDNVRAFRAGYEYARESYRGKFDCSLRRLGGRKRMLLNGNEAVALGALAAGCKFVSAYPMTPASSITEYLAAKADEFGLVVVQPEDEISAINMVVGAAFAGVRAMTATSGSGFCLMTEGLGLAGITETPIVVVDGQRPGPAVGLPTRTEQGDMQFILYAHHGDFPRVVLAPADVEEAFYLTVRAFNLAERYQLPVIILTDQHLASSYAAVDKFKLSKVKINRGILYPGNGPAKPDYRRHAITRSGISPRAFPGMSEALVVTDSDEHDETGHLIEDAGTRTRMVDKRLRKLKGLKKEIAPPRRYGPEKVDTLLIGWGSSYGALREAVDILQGEGESVGLVQISELCPFPAEAVTAALDGARASYVVEGNASGQLARLIKAETGRGVGGKILKYDGRPFTPAYIVKRVREGGK